MYDRLFRCFIATLTAAALAGPLCGCSKNDEVSISGKVRMGNEPVPAGAITFVPIDGMTKVAGAQIRDGAYEAKMPPGEKIVQIGGTRMEQVEIFDALSGKTIVAEQPIRLTPELYETSKSPLRAKVTESGETFDFDIPKEE